MHLRQYSISNERKENHMSFVINEVTLQKLDDKMLQELFLKTRSKINSAEGKRNVNISHLKSLQIDMCYLQREIEMRSKAPSQERRK
tara:strand:- start:71 stop:331 length:261 start_codon:yes stop_codon:yes gene_type:complete